MKKYTWMMFVSLIGVGLAGTGCKATQSAIAGGQAATSQAASTGGSTTKAASATSKPSLLQTGMQAAPALMKLLTGGDAKAKASAKQQLLGMGVKAIPTLLGALRGKDTNAQKSALDVLGSMGKKASGAKDDVTKLTKSSDAGVRSAANDTLKKIQ